MTKRISRAFVDDLVANADIVGLIQRYVPLKKAGRDYQACCPFHQEKTPSFTVSPSKGFYYCFGCHAKGNALHFLMAHDHLSFVDAVEKLAEISSVPVVYETLSATEIQQQSQQKDLYALMADACAHYQQNLLAPVGMAAQNYLASRQVDLETAAFFALGYAQNQGQMLPLFAKTYGQDALKAAGLISEQQRVHDFFRNRLMFPIRDSRGRVLGFGARALDDSKPKYLNSGETLLFNKSRVLYGLYELLQTTRQVDYLIVVEGYMDVIALQQMGVYGAVATLGTAFTEQHLKLVQRYTQKIYFCFDGDAAGRKAANRAMQQLLPVMQLSLDIRMVFLPEGDDPDTLVRREGKAAFIERLSQSQRFSEFIYENLIADSDLRFVEARGDVVKRAQTLLETMAEGDYKSLFLQGLNEKIGFDLLQFLTPQQPPLKVVTNKSQRTNKQRKQSAQPIPFAAAFGSLETRLLRALLADPTIAYQVNAAELLQTTTEDYSADRDLLYRLLRLFQTVEIKADAHILREVEPYFNQDENTRLLQIMQKERLLSSLPGEAIETSQARIREEVMFGFSQLFNACLRKNFYAKQL